MWPFTDWGAPDDAVALNSDWANEQLTKAKDRSGWKAPGDAIAQNSDWANEQLAKFRKQSQPEPPVQPDAELIGGKKLNKWEIRAQATRDAPNLAPAVLREPFYSLASTGASLTSTATRPFSKGAGDFFAKLGEDIGAISEDSRKDDWSPWFSRMYGGAVGSAAQATIMAPGGLAGMTAGFAATEGNQALYDAEQAGITGNDRLKYGAVQGAIEGTVMSVFNRIGLPGMEGLITKVGSGVMNNVGKQFLTATAQELPEELLTELGHAIAEATYGVRPEAMNSEQLTQRLIDTVAQTVLTVGMVSVTGKLDALEKASEKGFITEGEGQALGLTPDEMKNRSTRKKAVDQKIDVLEQQIRETEEALPNEVQPQQQPTEVPQQAEGTEVRPGPDGEVEAGGQVQPPNVAEEAAPPEDFTPPADGVDEGVAEDPRRTLSASEQPVSGEDPEISGMLGELAGLAKETQGLPEAPQEAAPAETTQEPPLESETQQEAITEPPPAKRRGMRTAETPELELSRRAARGEDVQRPEGISEARWSAMVKQQAKSMGLKPPQATQEAVPAPVSVETPSEPTVEEEAISELPKVGDNLRLMSVESTLADAREIDGVRYELYNDASMKGKGGTVRVFDVDSGNVVSMTRFPDYRAAEAKHNKAITSLQPVTTETPAADRRTLSASEAPSGRFGGKSQEELQDIEQMYRDNIATKKANGQKVPADWEQGIQEVRARLAKANPETEIVTDSEIYGHPQNPLNAAGDESLVPIKLNAKTDLSWRIDAAQKSIDEIEERIGRANAESKKNLKGKKSKAYHDSYQAKDDAHRLDNLRQARDYLGLLQKQQEGLTPPVAIEDDRRTLSASEPSPETPEPASSETTPEAPKKRPVRKPKPEAKKKGGPRVLKKVRETAEAEGADPSELQGYVDEIHAQRVAEAEAQFTPEQLALRKKFAGVKSAMTNKGTDDFNRLDKEAQEQGFENVEAFKEWLQQPRLKVPAKQSAEILNEAIGRQQAEVESLPGQGGLSAELKRLAEETRKQRDKAVEDFRDEIDGTLFADPFSNPKLVKMTGDILYKYAKTGVLDAAVTIDRMVKEIGQELADYLLPVIRAEWDKLQASGEFKGMKPFEDAEQADNVRLGDEQANTPEPPPEATQAPSPGADLTSIKNEMVNDMREELGIGPLPEPVSETFEEWVDVAIARYEKTGGAIGAALVSEQMNPKTRRNLKPIESTILQVHLRRTKSIFNDAAEALFEARESGDPVASAIAHTRASNLSDTLAEIGLATKYTGTEAGRSLVSRRMVMEPDFTLADMVTEARVRNAGEPLPKDVMADLTEKDRRIRELQEELKAEQQKNAELESQQRVDAEIGKTAKPKRQGKRAKAREKATSAVASFKEKWNTLYQVGIVPDPKADAKKWVEITDAAVEVVKAYTELGVYSLGEFLSKAKAAFGGLTPYQEEAFKEGWNREKEAGNIPVPELDQSNARAVSREARRIMRSVVEAGITDRETVVDIVHESLKEIIPEITRRETMDAISTYGQYALLPKDEVAKTERAIRGELQQLAKLDDMRQGRAPSKTGVERREVGDEERHLLQQVNEVMKRGGFVVTNPASQLRTALKSAKTAVQNSLSDMRYEMERGEKIVRERSKLVPDAELTALKKERAAVREAYKEMFPPLDVSEQKKLQATLRGLDRTIGTLEEQLAKREVEYGEPPVPMSSPEIDVKRARIAELRALRDAMRLDMGLTEERSRKLYEANLQRRLAEYAQLIADKDFAEKPKREPRKLSRRELNLKRELEDIKSDYFHMVAEFRVANLKGLDKVKDIAKETAHLSRAVMTSADLSAVFRQGGGATFSHPLLAKDAAAEMVYAMVSQEAEFATLEHIRNHPLFQLAEQSGLSITEREGKATKQEEAYMGRWANKLAKQDIKGVKAPLAIAGKGVAASARAYTTYLNSLRFGLFRLMVDNLGKNGEVTLDEAKVISNFINISTGRGNLGGMMQWAEGLNAVFFAPRYVISRFQYIGGVAKLPFLKTSGRVKKALAMEYARHAAGVTTFMGLVVALGALLAGDDDDEVPTVELDPRSTDFLKIKWGETRIDPMSGLSQVMVLAGKTATGERKTARGEIRKLVGPDRKFGDRSWVGEVGRFIWSKSAPVISTGIEMRMGEDFVGGETTMAGSLSRAFIPLSFREVQEVMEARGIPEGAAISALALLGMGIATYGPKTDARREREARRRRIYQYN